MPTIRHATRFDAPTERVFDLARSVDLLGETLGRRVTPIAGDTGGLSARGTSTVWRTSVLGTRVEFTTRVTAYSRPHHFRQTMTAGPFERLIHDYFFAFETDEIHETVLRDVLTYESPYGPLGRVVDRTLEDRIEALLAARGARLREIAESESSEWQRYVDA
jgi:ligand-binding SRPBCC domain-containing protein